MFEYMEELSVTETENLRKTISNLFRQTCILQVKYDPVTLTPRDNLYYEMCVRHGGIRIFLFNKDKIFPRLKPYKMDRECFVAAVTSNAGRTLETEKCKKLEQMNAGELEELRSSILEYGMEIEQEMLV